MRESASVFTANGSGDLTASYDYAPGPFNSEARTSHALPELHHQPHRVRNGLQVPDRARIGLATAVVLAWAQSLIMAGGRPPPPRPNTLQAPTGPHLGDLRSCRCDEQGGSEHERGAHHSRNAHHPSLSVVSFRQERKSSAQALGGCKVLPKIVKIESPLDTHKLFRPCSDTFRQQILRRVNFSDLLLVPVTFESLREPLTDRGCFISFGGVLITRSRAGVLSFNRVLTDPHLGNRPLSW